LLLLATLFAAGAYIEIVAVALADGIELKRLPDFPAELLLITGLSSSTYVAAKIVRT
jgi:hypothetical protein